MKGQNMINGLESNVSELPWQRLKTTIQKARQHYAPIRTGYPARRTKSPCAASLPLPQKNRKTWAVKTPPKIRWNTWSALLQAAVLSRQGSWTDGPLHPSGTNEADIGKMDKSSRKRASVTGLSIFQTAAVLIMMQVVKFFKMICKTLKILTALFYEKVVWNGLQTEIMIDETLWFVH